MREFVNKRTTESRRKISKIPPYKALNSDEWNLKVEQFHTALQSHIYAVHQRMSNQITQFTIRDSEDELFAI